MRNSLIIILFFRLFDITVNAQIPKYCVTANFKVPNQNRGRNIPFKRITGTDSIFIDTFGSDVTGNGSKSNPYFTIQKGIDNATSGIALIIGVGRFSGTGNTNLNPKGKSIIIQSAYGPGQTIIDGEGKNRGFYLDNGETSSTKIRGLSVINCFPPGNTPSRNNTNGHGGAIFCDENSGVTVENCYFFNCKRVIDLGNREQSTSQVTYIRNCVFEKNSTSCIIGDKVTFYFDSCIFQNNEIQSIHGKGHVYNPPGSASCNIFRNNYSQSGVISETGHGFIISNSLYYDNKSGLGVVYHGTTWTGNPAVDHCTFYNNCANQYTTSWYDHLGTTKNSIFAGFNTNILNHISGNQSSIDFKYNNCTGITNNGNFSGDPGFLDTLTYDFTLKSNSICIGKDENGNNVGADFSKFPKWMLNFPYLDTLGCKIPSHKKLTSSDTLTACSSLKLTSKNRNYKSYKWSNGDTTISSTITKSGLVTILETDTNGCKNIDTVYVRLISKTVDTTVYNSKLGDTLKINPNKWFNSSEFNYYNSQRSTINLINTIYQGKDSIIWKGFASLKTNTNLKCPISGKVHFFNIANAQSQAQFTWNKILSDSLIDKSRLNLGSSEQFDRENQVYYSVWASSSSNAKIQKFDLKNNQISTVSARSWPGELRHSIYNPVNNYLMTKRAGRDNTYYLNSNNVWTKNGNGSHDDESYDGTDFYNGVSGNMSYLGGYGWFSTKNWIFEQNGSSWNTLISNQNSCSFPKRVGAKVASSKDHKTLFISSGQGSCDGNQFASSCSLGSPWATDVGVYCWIRDLQKLDLTTNSITSILPPNNSSIDLHGELAFDYDENAFYMVGGFIPAPKYSSNTANDSSVYIKVKRLRVGIDTSFITIPIFGNGPPIVKMKDYKGVAFYDSKGKRIVWLRSDGVWELKSFNNKPCNNHKKLTTADTLIACSSLKLTSKNKNYKSYKWSNGDTTISSTITNSGLVTLLESDTNGCKNIDAVFVRLLKDEIYNAPDTSICNVKANDTLKLELTNWFGTSDFYFYKNQSRVDTAKIFIRNSSTRIWGGMAALKGDTTRKCPVRGTIFPSVIYPRLFKTDTIVSNKVLFYTLKPTINDRKYTTFANCLWSNGDTSRSSNLVNSGKYWFKQTDSVGCSQTDTVHFSRLNLKLPLKLNLKQGTKITLKVNDSSNLGSTVKWNNSHTGWSYTYTLNKFVDTIITTQYDNYSSITVSTILAPCFMSNYIPLSEKDTLQLDAHTINFKSKNPNSQRFRWSTGDTTSSLIIAKSGWYSLIEVDKNGCVGQSKIYVSLWCKPLNHIPLSISDSIINCTSSNLYSKNKNYKSYQWSNGDTRNFTTAQKSGLLTLYEVDKNGCKNIDSVYVRLINNEISIAPDTILCNVRIQDTLKLNLTNWFRKTDYNYFNDLKNQVNTTTIFVTNTNSLKWTGFAALKSDPNIKCPISGLITPYLTYPRLVNRFTDTINATTNTVKPAVLSKQYSRYTWSNGETAFTTQINNSGNYWFRHSNDIGCSQTDSFHFSRINLTIPSKITAKFGSKILLKVKDSLNTSSYVVWSTGDTGWYTVYTVSKNTDTIFATQQDAYRSVTKFTVITGRLEPIRTIEEYDNFDNDSNGNSNAQNNTAGIEVSNVNNIRIYPNPVGSEITLDGLSRQLNYEIHTVTGRLVQSGKTSPKINVESLKSGLFILKLENFNYSFIKN